MMVANSQMIHLYQQFLLNFIKFHQPKTVKTKFSVNFLDAT